MNERDKWYEETGIYGVDLKLGAGILYGIIAEYGISPNLGLRGRITSFSTKTSSKGYWSSGWLEAEYDMDFELSMRSLVFSRIYRLPLEMLSAYMGAGVGQFATRVELSGETRWYEDEVLKDIWTESLSQNDSPIGLELLGGIEYSIKNLLLAAEMKYTATKADVGLFGVGDLGGLSLILGVLYEYSEREVPVPCDNAATPSVSVVLSAYARWIVH